jgi:hypothetical protein
LLAIACLCSQWADIAPAYADQLQQQKNISAASTTIGGCPIFPANNIWNTPINNKPVHVRSNQWINTIGRNTGLHMDFGSGTWDGGPIGIPYNIVGSGVPKVPVSFYYPGESDPGPYPIPANPLIEHGSDHHILIVDDSTCTLYELFDASYSGGSWHAGSGAIWNLNSNVLRPDTWTSADAAGLPILPGLVRYDEIVSGAINHAIRFTAAHTNGYIWPARHLTSNNPNTPQIPPMGARFRLKASVNISGYPPAMQVILRAMKTYGIILADNGSNWYVSGAPDSRWDNDMLHLLDDLTGNDFEAVDVSGLMVDYNSGATGSAISGNTGAAGTILSYTDGAPKTAISQVDGSYSLLISNNWSGTVTPSHACFTFAPTNRTYSGVTTNQTAQNYTPTFNPASGCANVDVIIGGTNRGNYGVTSGGQQRVEYTLDSGPVKVVSTNGVPIIAALRDSWKDSTTSTWTSFVQMMGLPKEQLSDTYYFPSYNNVSLSGQLRFGNVDTVGTWVRVVIGGVERGRYYLDPSQQARVEYDLDSGPVVIESETAGVKIIAALRDAWWDGTRWTSFSQMMGLPKEQLSDSYYFPSYNNISLSGQLRFGNVDTVGTWVRVVIGGVQRGRYFLDPSEQQRVEYDLDSGPVVIESETAGVKIIAALRDAWFDGVSWTSYVHLMGLPKESLSDTYYLPAYNNVSLSGQLRFGNVDTVGTWVRVVIGGEERGRYFLDPSEQVRVEYALDSGPVVIESETVGVKIIAALRDSWYDGKRWTSFAQMMGLPALSDTYYFPSYNNISLSGQLRFGAP